MDNDIVGDIRLLRMKTGEDVVALLANYSEDDEVVELVEPMLVKKTRLSGKWETTLIPWLPIDIIEYNVCTLSIYDILFIMEPTEFFIEEYKMSVDHFLQLIGETQPIEQLYTKVLESFEFPETKH